MSDRLRCRRERRRVRRPRPHCRNGDSDIHADAHSDSNRDGDVDAHSYIYTKSYPHSEEHTADQAAPNPATAVVGSATAIEVKRHYPVLGPTRFSPSSGFAIENSLELGCWDLELSVTACGKADRYQRRE